MTERGRPPMTTPLIIQPETREAIGMFMQNFESCREILAKRLAPEDAVPLFLSYTNMLEKLLRDVGQPREPEMFE